MSFTTRFVALIVIEAILIIGLFIHISSNTLTAGYTNSTLRLESTLDFFFIPLLLVIFITGVGISLAGMVTFILLSHRIAGPLFRFESDMKDISQGDLTKRTSLRRTDQLTELKEALNVLTSSMDERLGRVKDMLQEIETLMLDKNSPDNNAKLNKAISSLRNEVDRFKVTQKTRK